MGKYIKWMDGKDVCLADLRSDTVANYYRNGKLYAKLQKFIPRDSDVEISEEEFNNLTKK